jgi:hypothetical protein
MKYKFRCRKNGVLIDTKENLYKYDIVWKREFNPEIYSIDKLCKDNQ